MKLLYILLAILLFFALNAKSAWPTLSRPFGFPKIEGFESDIENTWYPWYPYYLAPPYYTSSRYYLNNPNWARPYRIPKWRKKFRKPVNVRYGPMEYYGYRYRKSLQNFP